MSRQGHLAANNYGVYLIGSEIYTDQGNITVTGYGGSSDGYDNYGVFFGATNMYTNYQTPDASYGTITIEGHGGGNATSTSDSNHGVFLTDGTWLEAAGGVDITGFGGLGSGQENTGVRIEDSYLDTYKDNYNESGTYTGTSTGEISITGTGGGEVDGDGSGHGVYVSNSEILAEQGNITINGTAGQGSASSASAGVFMDGAYIDTRTTDLTDPQDIVSGSVTIEGTATKVRGSFLRIAPLKLEGGGSIF